jgi:microcystin-dependent protein
MALETGTYIDSLNASNPAATDALAQADDHLRLIKATLKATFPNVTGAVTATHAEMNSVSAITSNGSVPSLASGITGAEVKTLIGAADAAITTNGSTPALASGITAEEVRALIGASATAATLLAVYPVGSIYTSVVATSPATYFGGTWAVFGAGRVLTGFDNSQTEFDTVEETGGSNTHTLTIAEMPAHTHSINLENTRGSGAAGAEDGVSSFESSDTNSTGGGTAHPILQPYIVVHMWKRTA